MKALAFTALACMPHPWRVELLCRFFRASRRAAAGDLYCNVCDTRLARFRGLPSAEEQARNYGASCVPPDHASGQRAFCPVCGEAERERLLFWLLSTEVRIDGKRVLATSPGLFSQRALMRRCRYVSSNFEASPLYARDANLCQLPFESGSFEAVISFHVLEHVPDDARAMNEIHRVLAPGGTLLLCVPQDLQAPRTLRATTETPEERTLRFGHPGHLRLYGADVPQILESHGFAVRTYGPQDVPEAERRRLALLSTDRVHVARKLR